MVVATTNNEQAIRDKYRAAAERFCREHNLPSLYVELVEASMLEGAMLAFDDFYKALSYDRIFPQTKPHTPRHD